MLKQLLAFVIPALLSTLATIGEPMAAEQKALQTLKSTKSLNAAPPVVVAPPRPSSVPLTSGECTGLGGHVEERNQTCNAKGQKACKTVDHHGVVRVACIDEVKN